ncbi:MAG TPA: thrombospondin type 3 repeat-containing protein [Thermoplasmata archaeon]|nr:thrombospondin type 3 repeat-containing protein [Thermoplasmata archaeon]
MRREFVVSLFAMVIALGALTVPPSAVGAPDPGWGTPLPFEFTVGAVGEPEVAVDAEGNAVAVWNQPYGSASDNVVASRYVPGLGWGPVQVLDAFTASAARDPKVAMNAQGRAVAVWYEFDTDLSISAAVYDPGSGWGQPVRIENLTHTSYEPEVAIDHYGNAIAIWRAYMFNGTNNYWIATARYDRGTGWASPVLLDAGTGQVDWWHIGMSPQGDAIVLWNTFVGSAVQVWANRFSPQTGWGVTTILDPNIRTNGDGSVALDARGNGMVVWHAYNGAGYILNASQYVPGSGWTAPFTMFNQSNIIAIANPEVAMDLAGNAVAVWTAYTPGPLGSIWGASFTPAQGWAPAVPLELSSAYAIESHVAMDGSGGAIAVWAAYNGAYYDLWSSRFGLEVGWNSSPTLVESLSNDVQTPEVGAGCGGAAVAVWRYDDGLWWSGMGNAYAVADADQDGLSDSAEGSVHNTDYQNLDTDGDGLKDGAEVCLYYTDPRAADSDGDGLSDGEEQFLTATDPLDSDSDSGSLPDGWEVANGLDPNDPADDTADADGDGLSNLEEYLLGTDPRDADTDGDGVPDNLDPFPTNGQEYADTDGDGIGNTLDSDDDNDGVPDGADAFPWDATEWADHDADGLGDNADSDDDNDGIPDVSDPEPLVYNAPPDADADGIPDAIDPDDDNDGIADASDAFPMNPDETSDTDGDGAGDNADTDDDADGWPDTVEESSGTDARNATSVPNDLDGDGIADIFDPDIDGDGVANTADYDPFDPAVTAPPPDFDGDGLPDGPDTDDDNDGAPDASDVWPNNPNEWLDTDSDGTGNNADSDDDGDGWADVVELTVKTNPLSAASTPVDTDGNGLPDVLEAGTVTLPPADLDGDGTPDATDPDVDGDGALNAADACPRDPRDTTDTDGDGLCDNADQDDDGDGALDVQDAYPFDATRSERAGAASGSEGLLVAALILLVLIAVLLLVQLVVGMRRRGGEAKEPPTFK